SRFLSHFSQSETNLFMRLIWQIGTIRNSILYGIPSLSLLHTFSELRVTFPHTVPYTTSATISVYRIRIQTFLIKSTGNSPIVQIIKICQLLGTHENFTETVIIQIDDEANTSFDKLAL